jgi:hypothetical protein
MTPFWINDITILMNKHQLILWPTNEMTMNEKLNAITRLVILLCITGFIATQNMNFVWISIVTIACIVVYYKLTIEKPETFEIQKMEHHTIPTDTNPMMNVLLPELNGNPKRKSALQYSHETEKLINNKVKKHISKNVDPRIFQGINNELDLEYSMRNFYTTASTTIPNDQEGFGKFCYGEMISAKEGDPVALLKQHPRMGSVTN